MRQVVVTLLVAVVAGGCATLPTGPSVMVLPGAGKPFEQFQADDAECRQWAARSVGADPDTAAKQSTISGAAIGTALGAAAGAAIGAAAGSPGRGAAVGAGVGLLGGSAVGADAGRVHARDAQRRYDNTYQQCMYAKGNQIPGVSGVRYPPPPPRRSDYPGPPPPPPASQPPPPPPAGTEPPPPPKS